MKYISLTVAAMLVFLGGMAVGLSKGKAPDPRPEVRPAPAGPAAVQPSGDAPVDTSEEFAKLRRENEALRKKLAEGGGLQAPAPAPADAAKPAKAISGYDAMKLMDDGLRSKMAMTADQETRMRDAMVRYLKDCDDVRQREGWTEEQKQAELQRLKASLELEFQGILSASQYAELMGARGEKKERQKKEQIAGQGSWFRASLGLNEAQAAQVDAILRAYFESSPDALAQGKAYTDETLHAQIRSVLQTPDQVERLERLTKKR